MSKPDRREKKKNEREEKRKAYRQRKQRLIRREKVEEYSWLAEEAFARKEYRDALDWALKGLGIAPLHRPLMNLALSSAQILGDDPTLYNLLRQCCGQRCGQRDVGSNATYYITSFIDAFFKLA